MSRIKFLPVQLAGSTLIYLMNRVQPANTRLIVPQKRQERATVGMGGETGGSPVPKEGSGKICLFSYPDLLIKKPEIYSIYLSC
jgi:hypothetical protein